MRKIESLMNRAIARKENWSQANTEVVVGFQDNATVWLHGHHIATVSPGGTVAVNLETLQDWPTSTTKSRLRALGVPVYTKAGRVYVDGCDVAHYGYRTMTIDYTDTRYIA